MIEFNQTFLTGILIGLVAGFIAHSLISKSIRIILIVGAIGLLAWLFYSNGLS